VEGETRSRDAEMRLYTTETHMNHRDDREVLDPAGEALKGMRKGW